MVGSRPRPGVLAGQSEPWARLALNLKIFRRCFSLIGNFIVFDDLPLIQTAEASLFDGGDMDKHILSASALRINPYPFCALNHFTVPRAIFQIPKLTINDRVAKA